MSVVIAPPYDVIDEVYQDELYERSPYNIIRLILTKGDNRYADAQKFFEDWKKENVLKKLEKPSIFYIEQKYTTENAREVIRKGFIARNKIEEFGKGNVFPHEFTMCGPKADRLKLVSACKAFFSQIFMVYSDPTKLLEEKIGLKTSKEKPFIDVKDDAGVIHKIWIIDDENDSQGTEIGL